MQGLSIQPFYKAEWSENVLQIATKMRIKAMQIKAHLSN